VSIALLDIFQSNGFTIKKNWPTEWATGTQAILMVLIADFFRYWLHRLSHKWKPLWRLHAVHHSPHKLYSMNVGRFHPLEKSIQFIFDALPFIILGISENVLALYFVFYSINGFFQHCNIRVYLGPLNYLISGPELHRWHHSVKINESNNNFGNNLIIWDLLFGTWHLPKEIKVEQLGLINRNYPLGLIEQLKSPFIKGLDQEEND
jgi:sterol desaturase/sphingolipid hydroxylase (fatty acid hydroxylase superfamily)